VRPGDRIAVTGCDGVPLGEVFRTMMGLDDLVR
jgi:hypothetical protein